MITDFLGDNLVSAMIVKGVNDISMVVVVGGVVCIVLSSYFVILQVCAQMRVGAFKCKRNIRIKCKCKCSTSETNASANAQELNQM